MLLFDQPRSTTGGDVNAYVTQASDATSPEPAALPLRTVCHRTWCEGPRDKKKQRRETTTGKENATAVAHGHGSKPGENEMQEP